MSEATVQAELLVLKGQLDKLDRDRRTAASKVASIDRARRETRERIAALRVEARGGPARATKPSARAQAGRHADSALAALKAAGRPLSQREIGARGSIGTGTLSYAIQALVEDRLVVPTGELDGRSKVYRLTTRRETRRAPGS